tara:strand:- start:40733 stop:41242 length:510 start_codon:yes stop_codon:yes gene_type:complete
MPAVTHTDGVSVNGGAGIGFTRSCTDTRCSISISDPTPLEYLSYFETEVGPISDYPRFFVDDDYVYWKEMSFGLSYLVTQTSLVTFDWTYSGMNAVFNLAGVNVNGALGTISLLLHAGDVFKVIGGGSAYSSDAQLTLNMKAGLVPIPASLFLFAPALLGLIGLRRRLS